MLVLNRIRAAARAVAVALFWGLIGIGHVAAQPAQPAPTLALPALKVGQCEIVVRLTNPRPGDQVGVVVALTQYREQTVIAGTNELRFALGEPLRQGFKIVARLNGADAAQAEVTGSQDGGSGLGTCAQSPVAGESPFDASFFIGEVIDTFAPDKVGGYKNPTAGTAQKLQNIFGVDFDYRAIGRSDSPVQFWIQGETQHGVRTADINCKPEDPADRPPVCDKPTPENFGDRARFILEHATSLEAFISPRVEFRTLQRGSDSPAKLYGTARLGFISLEEAPKVFRVFHAGVGLLADEGNFQGSYFEVGWGLNELFSPDWNRLKVNGLLSFSMEKIPLWRDNGRFFIEMMIDNDLHDGPDSVRTLFGVDIDLRKVAGQ